MPFKHSWKTHEKRGGSGAKYLKYDTVLKVIIAEPEEAKTGQVVRSPSAIYLTKLAMELLGDPAYVEIVRDGDIIGFRATLEEDPNGYVVNRPVERDEEGKEVSRGRPFLSAVGVIKKYGLRPGVYNAEKEVNGSEVVVYFNSKGEPSKA